MSEGAVVNACLKYLFMMGCYVWRQNSGAYKPEGSRRWIRYGFEGCSDIVGVTPRGKMIAVECKYGRNKPTAKQLEFGKEVTKRGGIFIVAYSVDDIEKRKWEITGGP